MRALPIRKQTRFAPPSSHIFCTSSSEGIAEVLGKPPGIWSGVSVCWGLEASPTVCCYQEALLISWSCSMGCQHSPYTFPGCKGTLWSHWGHCGKFTIRGCGTFWWHLAQPGCYGARGGGFLAGEGILSASGGTSGEGVLEGYCSLGSSSGACDSSCFGLSSCTGGHG